MCFTQEQGVAEHRVKDVIKTVVETVTERAIGPLPLTSTQCRLASEMKALSRQQIREEISGKSNFTVKYDGTTKGSHGHIAEVELATPTQTLMTGMIQQPGGLASDYVQSIGSSVNKIREGVLRDTTNTMTDRCITNAAVDAELGEMAGKKIELLPVCPAPPRILDSFAKKADSILSSLDKEEGPPPPGALPFHRRGESCTQALLRAADKLFNNAASGDNIALKTFLKDRGFESNLPRWVGNRFNILFCEFLMYFFVFLCFCDLCILLFFYMELFEYCISINKTLILTVMKANTAF